MVAEDDVEIPKSLQNIVVSIHAIATFQALHDYLRPRVAGVIGGSASRLSGMLAALAATYGGVPRGEPGDPPSASAPVGLGGSLESMAFPSGDESASAPLGRRRSQRLSAKTGLETSSSVPDIEALVELDPSSSALESQRSPPCRYGADCTNATCTFRHPETLPEPTPSETVVDRDLDDDMSDEEVDAEVFDDPDNSISDKTVSLSVAEGMWCCRSLMIFRLISSRWIESRSSDPRWHTGRNSSGPRSLFFNLARGSRSPVILCCSPES